MRRLILACILVYAVLLLRYYFTRFPDFTTLYIETPGTTPVRNDTFTIYPAGSAAMPGRRYAHVAPMYRSFTSTFVHCRLGVSELTHLRIYAPETPMAASTWVWEWPLHQIAKEVPDVPTYIEIPLSGHEIVHIPRGWWIHIGPGLPTSESSESSEFQIWQ